MGELCLGGGGLGQAQGSALLPSRVGNPDQAWLVVRTAEWGSWGGGWRVGASCLASVHGCLGDYSAALHPSVFTGGTEDGSPPPPPTGARRADAGQV